MSDQPQQDPQNPEMPLNEDGTPMTEEQLAAAYEAQVKALRVEDVVLQTVVSLLNLAGRKAGLVPGTEDERDLGQLGLAIEAAMRLFPLVEPALGEDAGQLKDAISQLQMAYVQLGGQVEGGPGGPGPGPGGPAQPAPPKESPLAPPGAGKLWVPGQ
ncbi:hypothetical protein DSM112329_03156 [Paraconexibacter sp. AEG42_29]|uniref:DUF1844 domain-containing protein n=1 Tax=Paraconexibacter sp. AEG42_29 TaxID=2997339 RepID=A0AAU7AXC6_9ACTN